MKLRATSRPQTHARVCVCVCVCVCVIESESEHAWDSIIRHKVLTTLTLNTHTLPHMHQCTCRISFPLAYTHLFYMLKVAGIYTTAKKSSVTTKSIILILIPWWRNVLRMYIFTSNLMNIDCCCIVFSGYVLDYNLLARQQDQDGCGGFLLKTKKKLSRLF